MRWRRSAPLSFTAPLGNGSVGQEFGGCKNSTCDIYGQMAEVSFHRGLDTTLNGGTPLQPPLDFRHVYGSLVAPLRDHRQIVQVLQQLLVVFDGKDDS